MYVREAAEDGNLQIICDMEKARWSCTQHTYLWQDPLVKKRDSVSSRAVKKKFHSRAFFSRSKVA